MESKDVFSELFESLASDTLSVTDKKDAFVKQLTLAVDRSKDILAINFGSLIKEIYDGLKNNAYEGKSIQDIDVIRASEIYKEYEAGMLQFIDDIMNSDVNQGEDNKQKLNDATNKNEEFILSIFGGDRNPLGDESISDAMKNVEFLVDFISNIQDAFTKCNELVGKCISGENEIYDGCCVLYMKSYSLYAKCVLANIFDSINKIQNLSKVPTSDSTPTYKLL